MGYRFQVDLLLPPANAKAAIRRRLKPWFEAKNGARGWILGPFICLWRSAFDRYGPMLFGTIKSNNFGTRISGRAGSDLNGIAALLGIGGLLFFVLGSVVLNGGRASDILVPLLFFLILTPVIPWLAHNERREAEPLVRFLEETVTGPRPKKRPIANDISISGSLTLDVDGSVQEAPLTAERIAGVLESIEEDGFLILSSAPDVYIQTAANGGNFIIEKRDGGPDSHLEAIRGDAPDSTWLKMNFTFEETLAALLAYASDEPFPNVVQWRAKF